MQFSFWLRVKATKSPYGGFKAAVPTATKEKPSVGKSEIAFQVNLDIPDSYFSLPEFKASISLPDIRQQQPTVNTEMEQRVAELLKENLGINVTFTPEKGD